MLIDKGKVLKERLHKYSKESGISLTKIAEKAGYDQSMLYRHFDKPDLQNHIILKYARAIRYDFSEEIPEIKHDFYVEEDRAPYGKSAKTLNLDECLKEVDLWREKYIQLLEKHNQMLLEKLGEK